MPGIEKCREGATWVLCDGAGLASPRTTSGPQAMYRATTRSIEATATPQFLDERSSPANNYYFWAYTIGIVKRGSGTLQLLHPPSPTPIPLSPAQTLPGP